MSALFLLPKLHSDWVADIPELPNITNVGELSSPERGKYASLIRQRHERLAFAFRKLMTGYQSFEQHSAYRQTFYEEVIELATEVKFPRPSQFLEYDKSSVVLKRQ